ncbi:hypothetical protein ANANG_G00201410 [Anguilla anguilla]|uniref:Uncharacterized protein n=1 Tax=Anguilla anguilla TaxID=7936 RepID=A0A9D3LZB2_ANGAN|nr:hypothetical protein ANANG_G00201410 [Anguilla anguilla]
MLLTKPYESWFRIFMKTEERTEKHLPSVGILLTQIWCPPSRQNKKPSLNDLSFTQIRERGQSSGLANEMPASGQHRPLCMESSCSCWAGGCRVMVTEVQNWAWPTKSNRWAHICGLILFSVLQHRWPGAT